MSANIKIPKDRNNIFNQVVELLKTEYDLDIDVMLVVYDKQRKATYVNSNLDDVARDLLSRIISENT